MSIVSDKILNIQPVIKERKCGGWLAVSPAGAIVNIGVTGDYKVGAISQFKASVKMWSNILEENQE